MYSGVIALAFSATIESLSESCNNCPVTLFQAETSFNWKFCRDISHPVVFATAEQAYPTFAAQQIQHHGEVAPIFFIGCKEPLDTTAPLELDLATTADDEGYLDMQATVLVSRERLETPTAAVQVNLATLTTTNEVQSDTAEPDSGREPEIAAGDELVEMPPTPVQADLATVAANDVHSDPSEQPETAFGGLTVETTTPDVTSYSHAMVPIIHSVASILCLDSSQANLSRPVLRRTASMSCLAPIDRSKSGVYLTTEFVHDSDLLASKMPANPHPHHDAPPKSERVQTFMKEYRLNLATIQKVAEMEAFDNSFQEAISRVEVRPGPVTLSSNPPSLPWGRRQRRTTKIRPI